ncbi:MAG: tail fiber domain-containing protein, partial [Bacteroidetes bacterium]|nr:tail fiber domain-containing protein [Bacteroidota bacterium]
GGGNVGVKTNNPSYDFHVNGKMKSDGYTETSDRRLKKEIHTLENALDKVMALRGVSYYWRVDEFKDRNLDSRLQMGVIAQEIEEILPNVVDTDKEGYKSVQYTQLVPLLIEAMQEQQAIIDQQNILLQSNAGSISSMKQDIENLRVALEREGIEVEDSDSAEK